MVYGTALLGILIIFSAQSVADLQPSAQLRATYPTSIVEGTSFDLQVEMRNNGSTPLYPEKVSVSFPYMGSGITIGSRENRPLANVVPNDGKWYRVAIFSFQVGRDVLPGTYSALVVVDYRPDPTKDLIETISRGFLFRAEESAKLIELRGLIVSAEKSIEAALVKVGEAERELAGNANINHLLHRAKSSLNNATSLLAEARSLMERGDYAQSFLRASHARSEAEKSFRYASDRIAEAVTAVEARTNFILVVSVVAVAITASVYTLARRRRFHTSAEKSSHQTM